MPRPEPVTSATRPLRSKSSAGRITAPTGVPAAVSPVISASTSETVVRAGSMSSATTRPRRMTTMRSTTWNTWWMLWAMKMQECPEFAGAAHEVEHPLRLGDAEVVGRLVEDDEVAVEMHRARDRHRLALAARERARSACRAGSASRCRPCAGAPLATAFIASMSSRPRSAAPSPARARGRGCARSRAA